MATALFGLGKQGIKGVGESLSRIAKLGVKFVFVTNNSSKTRDQYFDFLNGIGVTVIPRDLIFFIELWFCFALQKLRI